MARKATHQVCEEMHQLSVCRLARDGLLTGSGMITWSRCGHVTGAISVQGDGDTITLEYVVDGQKVSERVLLDRTPVHLGGSRPWFQCPSCNRRVGMLYGGKKFRCRHCHDLRYDSQRQGAGLRAISRIQKVRRKLAGTGNLAEPPPTRPRYMHERTYRRLVRAEADAWQAFVLTSAK